MPSISPGPQYPADEQTERDLSADELEHFEDDTESDEDEELPVPFAEDEEDDDIGEGEEDESEQETVGPWEEDFGYADGESLDEYWHEAEEDDDDEDKEDSVVRRSCEIRALMRSCATDEFVKELSDRYGVPPSDIISMGADARFMTVMFYDWGLLRPILANYCMIVYPHVKAPVLKLFLEDFVTWYEECLAANKLKYDALTRMAIVLNELITRALAIEPVRKRFEETSVGMTDMREQVLDTLVPTESDAQMKTLIAALDRHHLLNPILRV